MRVIRVLLMVVFLSAVALTSAACGDEPPQNTAETESSGQTEEAGDGTTAETTGGATGGTTGGTTEGAATGAGQSNVAASYAIAQEEIEEAGGEKLVGDYRVGYIVESAEGWWQVEADNLGWRDSAQAETNHIEILPYDAQTGLLIPYMDIRLTILDESGEEVDQQELNFYWSEFIHYANNFTIPGSGAYTLRAELGAPDFARHGSEDGEGRVFTEPVTVEFDNVEIETGGE